MFYFVTLIANNIVPSAVEDVIMEFGHRYKVHLIFKTHSPERSNGEYSTLSHLLLIILPLVQ